MSDAVAADLRPLRVLLLEDSRFDAELLRENLLKTYPRARMTVVDDEAGFTTSISAGGWDVILSDYELPGFSGAQALAYARERLPDVPFVFVSGVIGEDNAVEMLKRGATDYVSKQRLNRLPLVLDRALRESADRQGRARAEARLREADAMYSRVVDSLRDYAVIMLDTEGGITTWNRAAQQIFGWEPHEMVGRPADILYTSEDRDSRLLRQRLASASAIGTAHTERWMMRKDGLRMRGDSVLTPVYNDDGDHTGYCAIVRDVTERFRQDEALRAAKEQAERANEAKDRFLAVLSHELRTPLTPIVAAVHVLERAAAVPARYQHLLPMIRRNVALEARLIDDLLDLSAIGAGKLSFRFAPTDMHDVIGRVVDMLREPLRDGNLRLVQDLRATDVHVRGDEARVQQIVWNLVRNAIKFTPAAGTVTLRTRSTADGSFVLECTDTGVGVPSEALDRIFTPFEQAHQDLSRTNGGLGLGLAIARALATEHGGELAVSSGGAGTGTTFTLTLPLMKAEAGLPEARDAQAGPGGGARLLLVEDNPDAAATMVEVLELTGYRVTHAATCAAALEAARTNVFDVVLTDLGLPDGSGIDVGRELGTRCPVVALSGYGSSPDLQRSSMAGFMDHLVKPADPDTVHRALQDAMRKHRERQQEERQQRA